MHCLSGVLVSHSRFLPQTRGWWGGIDDSILAIEESIQGGAPARPGCFAAMAAVSRSGDSYPADGGGDGGAVGALQRQTPYQNGVS